MIPGTLQGHLAMEQGGLAMQPCLLQKWQIAMDQGAIALDDPACTLLHMISIGTDLLICSPDGGRG